MKALSGLEVGGLGFVFGGDVPPWRRGTQVSPFHRPSTIQKRNF